MVIMSCILKCKCFGCYFSEANIRSHILTKPLVWSPIISIFSFAAASGLHLHHRRMSCRTDSGWASRNGDTVAFFPCKAESSANLLSWDSISSGAPKEINIATFSEQGCWLFPCMESEVPKQSWWVCPSADHVINYSSPYSLGDHDLSLGDPLH